MKAVGIGRVLGTPQADTPPAGDSSDRLATTAFVGGAIAAQPTPPGTEIGYDAFGGLVSITGTTSATANTVIAGSAHVFDGSPVLVECYIPEVTLPSVAAATISVGIFEGTTLLSILAEGRNPSSGSMVVSGTLKWRFSPSAGSHTYSIQGWVSSGTGNLGGGTGVGGAVVPAYLRFTKV